MWTITSFETRHGNTLAHKPNKNKRNWDVGNVLTKKVGESEYSLNLSFKNLRYFLFDFLYWKENEQSEEKGHKLRNLYIVDGAGDCFKFELLKEITGWAFFKENSEGVRIPFPEANIKGIVLNPEKLSLQVIGMRGIGDKRIIEIRIKTNEEKDNSTFVTVLFLKEEDRSVYNPLWLAETILVTLSNK